MENALQKMIKNRAGEGLRPDGTPYHRMLLADENDIAITHNIANREVQLQALSLDIIPERYCRTQLSITSKEQIRLLNPTSQL